MTGAGSSPLKIFVRLSALATRLETHATEMGDERVAFRMRVNAQIAREQARCALQDGGFGRSD